MAWLPCSLLVCLLQGIAAIRETEDINLDMADVEAEPSADEKYVGLPQRSGPRGGETARHIAAPSTAAFVGGTESQVIENWHDAEPVPRSGRKSGGVARDTAALLGWNAQAGRRPLGQAAAQLAPPIWVTWMSAFAANETLEDFCGDRGHAGCKQGCRCFWHQQCYPNRLAGGGSDVGVCSTSLSVLGLVSAALVLVLTGLVIWARIALQNAEYRTEVAWREAAIAEAIRGRPGKAEASGSGPRGSRQAVLDALRKT